MLAHLERYAKRLMFSSMVSSMSMFGDVAVSGCVGCLCRVDGEAQELICFSKSVKSVLRVILSVGSNRTVISVLQIYNGCCFPIWLRFTAF